VKSVYVTARVSEEVKAELEKIAKVERRTLSQVMLLLLESALAAKNGGGRLPKDANKRRAIPHLDKA